MNMLLISGLVAGLLSTAMMTLFEISAWKRWGLFGVYEWHENQAITTYLLGDTSGKTHYFGIFFFHFLNGTLAGIAFPYLVSFVLPYAPLLVVSIIYGIILWLLTLAPIHKPITGLSPWNHPPGRWPAVTSLVGHIIYGLVLGIIFLILG